MKDQRHRYDVALSFAGEDRSIAEQIASGLRQDGVEVFYDEYERASLWGKDLYVHLSEVYSKMARYCIMLLSEHYARKNWTTLERQSAQARAFQERQDYILPVRLDDTEIPGMLPTIGYLDLRQHSINDVVRDTLKKLGKGATGTAFTTQQTTTSAPGAPAPFTIPMPKMETKPTQRDRDRLLRETFTLVRRYFEQALRELGGHQRGVETDLTDVNNERFVCTIYQNGEIASKCMIWIGGLGSSNSIAYFEGHHFNSSENAMNECLIIEEQNGALYWKPMLSMFAPKGSFDQEGAARYLWERFINRSM